MPRCCAPGESSAVAERMLYLFSAYYQGDALQPLPRFARANERNGARGR